MSDPQPSRGAAIPSDTPSSPEETARDWRRKQAVASVPVEVLADLIRERDCAIRADCREEMREACGAGIAAALAEMTETIATMSLAGAKTAGMAAIDGALGIAAVHGYRVPAKYGKTGNSPMDIAMRAALAALRDYRAEKARMSEERTSDE